LLANSRDCIWARFRPRSWLALGYLIIFGSGIGFSAYLYILQKSTAARVATYAFVNPVVALFLGWLIGRGEHHAAHRHCRRSHPHGGHTGDHCAAPEARARHSSGSNPGEA